MRTLTILLPTTVLGLVLLSGCASPLPGGLGPGSLEDAIEQGTGGQVDVGTASLPADWPAELPVPAGDLFASISSDGTQVLTYRIADASVGESLVADLQALGFVTTATTDMGELVVHALERDEWTVSVSWVSGDEDGVVLNYSSGPH
jgi:hypothetical protein